MHRLRSIFNPKHPPRPVDLPPEIYGCIFTFSDNNDLLVLCTVCQRFRHLAQPILFNSVDLAYNHQLINVWFEMVASNPRLAAFVNSLTFGIVYSQMPSPPTLWLKIIAKGLNSLTNLKELNIRKMSSRFIPDFYAWILHGHPFRLKTFRNDLLDLKPTLSFLLSQPDISVWDHSGSTRCELPDNLLPGLVDIALPSWILPTLTSRPIVRISTVLKDQDALMECQFIDGLCHYSQSLTSLTLERIVINESMELAVFLAYLAEKLPLLEQLSLWHRGELKTDSSVASTAISASSFGRLATFSLLPPRSLNTDSVFKNVLVGQDEKQTATVFFETMPSLARITFPAAVAKHSLWYARSYEVAAAQDVVIKFPTGTR